MTVIIQSLIFYGGLVATFILGILSLLANFNIFIALLIVLIGLAGPCGVLIQRHIGYKHANEK